MATPLTNEEFQARMQLLRDMPPQAAMRFLKIGKSRWIDIAFAEGWSATLRDLVQSWVAAFIRKHWRVPAVDEIDRAWSNFSPIEHADYKRSGVRLNGVIEEELTCFRAGREPPPKKSLAELLAEFRASMAEFDLRNKSAFGRKPARYPNRKDVEVMRDKTPNVELHGGSLTERSRRMSGDT